MELRRSEERGMEKGMEKGREEGRKEGREEGMAKGRWITLAVLVSPLFIKGSYFYFPSVTTF